MCRAREGVCLCLCVCVSVCLCVCVCVCVCLCTWAHGHTCVQRPDLVVASRVRRFTRSSLQAGVRPLADASTGLKLGQLSAHASARPRTTMRRHGGGAPAQTRAVLSNPAWLAHNTRRRVVRFRCPCRKSHPCSLPVGHAVCTIACRVVCAFSALQRRHSLWVCGQRVFQVGLGLGRQRLLSPVLPVLSLHLSAGVRVRDSRGARALAVVMDRS